MTFCSFGTSKIKRNNSGNHCRKISTYFVRIRYLFLFLRNVKGNYIFFKVTLLRSNVKNAPKVKEIDFMMMVSGIFNTNSFETIVVQDKDHHTSLRGLYPMGALLNHACVPNTRHHYDSQQQLYVIAVRPISAGEEITMTYIDLFWDTILRRQVLSITKNFFCRCSRCSDPAVNIFLEYRRVIYIHLYKKY